MRTLYRNGALALATGPHLLTDHSLLVDGTRIAWLGPHDDLGDLEEDVRVVDAGGTSIVPGMVDSHSHTVLPGGSHWIARIGDPTDELLRVAEDNGASALAAGTRWLRDVGSPRRDGRALSLRVRDHWKDRRDRPYLRAAGSWVSRSGVLPPDISVEVEDSEKLTSAVLQQIEEGADLVKLYLDGPDPDEAPWTVDELTRVVGAAHKQGLRVTAHATLLAGARVGVEAGVDCIEHGSQLDGDVVAEMAIRGTFLFPTLAIYESWAAFSSTTTIDRFTSEEGRARIASRRLDAHESLRVARAAGVRIAAGTDFGGGSLRANQMAWEVECLVQAGLEPWEALAAATWVGGDLLGEPTAGRLEQGGPADSFLVHGNPLEDPRSLWRVWRVG